MISKKSLLPMHRESRAKPTPIADFHPLSAIQSHLFTLCAATRPPTQFPHSRMQHSAGRVLQCSHRRHRSSAKLAMGVAAP